MSWHGLPATDARPSGRRLATDALTVAVAFVVLGLMAFPFFWVVITSLRPNSELFSSVLGFFSGHITLENYRELLQGSGFATFIRNSLLVCGTAMVIAVTVALLAAYSFSRHRRFRGRKVLLILVITTQLFPFVILITPIYAIFFRIGLVNSFLGLIIAYIAITLPFSIYLLLGYLDTIPRELDEAAIVDGSSTLGVIFKVILPVAWPGVATVAIYAFVAAWDEFLFALTLMTDTGKKTIPVALAGFFGEYTTQWNLVMAAAVIATLPTLVLFMFVQRKLVSDLAAGAVKQ